MTGVGDAFCVGADLKTYIPQVTEMQRRMKSEQTDVIDGYRLDDGIKAVLRGVKIYKPIIAAVNGVCVAGGMEMLGGCDLRVAVPEATFAVMEPKRGLFAGGGTTVRLPRQIPFPHAMEFLLCADRIPAERAFHMGLLNEVVPHGRPPRSRLALCRQDHRQRPVRGEEDQGERSSRARHRHARGVQDRVRHIGGGLLERGRHRGAESVRREAASPMGRRDDPER